MRENARSSDLVRRVGLRAAAATSGTVGWEPLSLPVTIEGTAYRLDTMLAFPDDGRRHPLAILSHGSPRDGRDRPALRPTANVEAVLWFVRHGFAVASVMRRGYGRSGGDWAGAYGSCADPDYAAAGERGAADIAASVAALRSNPHVDASRMLAVGVSAGAFATVALTANPPPGLMAAVAFAPGRGSEAPDRVCSDDRLVAAFAAYGRTSRVPLLWISAPNDRFFDPPLVARARNAFDALGGKSTFFAAPASGSEGHYFFSALGASTIWGPPVAAFVASHGFAEAASPLDLSAGNVAEPRGLGPNGRAAFARYALDPPHKAFALSTDGFFDSVIGADSDEAARRQALARCPRAAKRRCAVVDVDGARRDCKETVRMRYGGRRRRYAALLCWRKRQCRVPQHRIRGAEV